MIHVAMQVVIIDANLYVIFSEKILGWCTIFKRDSFFGLFVHDFGLIHVRCPNVRFFFYPDSSAERICICTERKPLSPCPVSKLNTIFVISHLDLRNHMPPKIQFGSSKENLPTPGLKVSVVAAAFEKFRRF